MWLGKGEQSPLLTFVYCVAIGGLVPMFQDHDMGESSNKLQPHVHLCLEET